MWFLSYWAANFALIIVVTLAVVALGAVAWFAKNWKVAVAAAAVLAAGFAYMQIDKSAYQRRVAEEAAAQVKLLQGRSTPLGRSTKPTPTAI
jgi:positive regulator of sigma E activity